MVQKTFQNGEDSQIFNWESSSFVTANDGRCFTIVEGEIQLGQPNAKNITNQKFTLSGNFILGESWDNNRKFT